MQSPGYMITLSIINSLFKYLMCELKCIFSTYKSEASNERNFFGSSEKSFIPGMLSLSVGGSENTSWVLSPDYSQLGY